MTDECDLQQQKFAILKGMHASGFINQDLYAWPVVCFSGREMAQQASVEAFKDLLRGRLQNQIEILQKDLEKLTP